MARRRIQMRKIKQILELHYEKKLTQRQIAKLTEVSRPAVKEYLCLVKKARIEWDEIKNLPENEIARLLVPQKKISSRLDRLIDHFEAAIVELPQKGMTRILLWEEYREKDPDPYGYSQYCHHMDLWRKENQKLTCIIDHEPGAEMYLDYSGLKMPYYPGEDGLPVFAEMFVSVLGYSQKTFAMALESQNSLDTLTACNDAVRYFGGSAVAFIPDNMKTAVNKADKYEPIVNRSFEEFAAHYGAVVIPARPGRSRDKAIVENAVRGIQRQIIRRLRNTRCRSIRELNESIKPVLELYNRRPFQKTKQSRNDLWETVERAALRPLPSIPYMPHLIQSATVPPNCYVELKEDSHKYSVPFRYAGKPVKLLYTATSVEVRHENERIAFHARDRKRGGKTTIDGHLHPAQAWYRSLTASNAMRWARENGPYITRLADGIIERSYNEKQGCRRVMGILSLKKKYSKSRIEVACRLALREQNYSYQRVKSIIEKGLDRVFIESERMQQELPLHDNIRGASAYA